MMKDLFKNPLFYYILIPVVLAVWPLMVFSVYLPNTQNNYKKQLDQYKKAQALIAQILELDPGRLDFVDANNASAEFDYDVAVNKVARICGISAANCDVSSKPIRESGGGERSQECKVTLKKVGIENFAKFLSTIQLRWGNLQCTNLTLTKIKGLKNVWKVDLNFKYYY